MAVEPTLPGRMDVVTGSDESHVTDSRPSHRHMKGVLMRGGQSAMAGDLVLPSRPRHFVLRSRRHVPGLVNNGWRRLSLARRRCDGDYEQLAITRVL